MRSPRWDPEVVRLATNGLVGVLWLVVAIGGTSRVAELNLPRPFDFTPPSTAPPAPTAPAPNQTSPSKQRCAPDRTVAIEFGIVDAAAGGRYLRVGVRNCTQSALSLPAKPAIALVRADGKVQPVTWSVETGSTVSLRLKAGASMWLDLHWQTSGRCERGAAQMTVSIGNDRASRADCFQLGGLESKTTADLEWSQPTR